MSLVHLTVSAALAAGLGIQPMDEAPPPSADAPTESDDGQAAAGEACTVECLPEDTGAVILVVRRRKCDLDEECDDGNPDSHDGCSAECEIEDGYEPFVTAPALSTTR